MSTSWPNRDAFGVTSAVAPGDLDAIQTALRKIYAQVTSQTEWEALYRVIGTIGDDLEAVQTAIQTQTDPQTATGWSLDELGRGVGKPRNGLSDDEYRLAVMARGAALVGDGTIDSILGVLDVLAVADGATIAELWPAKIKAYLAGTFTLSELAVILAGLRDVVADGVGVVSVGYGDRPVSSVDAAIAAQISNPILGDSINVSITDPGNTAVTVYP